MKSNTPSDPLEPMPDIGGLLNAVQALIEAARQNVANVISHEQTQLYWHIGDTVRKDMLFEERAPYGERIVATLAEHLTLRYGRGYSLATLRHMVRFAEAYPDLQIVSTLWRQLSWSHFKELIYLEKPLHREFYAEMSRLERWSVRTLRERIDSLLFERTALSKKPEATIGQELAALRNEDSLTPDLVFRDPYVLDFLGLNANFSERDFESAILRELESFLLELGASFTFVARQQRMTIDGEDLYLDLLFYHRKLRRLVAIELKLGRFQAAYKGQMELYLRWLNDHMREMGEESPIGLILCSEKGAERIELLQLDKGDIRVAEYITEQLPPALLEKKIEEALRYARERFTDKSGGDA